MIKITRLYYFVFFLFLQVTVPHTSIANEIKTDTSDNDDWEVSVSISERDDSAHTISSFSEDTLLDTLRATATIDTCSQVVPFDSSSDKDTLSLQENTKPESLLCSTKIQFADTLLLFDDSDSNQPFLELSIDQALEELLSNNAEIANARLEYIAAIKKQKASNGVFEPAVTGNWFVHKRHAKTPVFLKPAKITN